MFSSSRYDRVTPLIRQLHCLKASERIYYTILIFLYTNAYMEQVRSSLPC